MNYLEKLKDPRWQKLRLEVMERDRFACLSCGRTDKTLNIHHGEYTPGGDPWDTPTESLSTLCEDCHKTAESFVKAVRKLGHRKHFIDCARTLIAIAKFRDADEIGDFLLYKANFALDRILEDGLLDERIEKLEEQICTLASQLKP